MTKERRISWLILKIIVVGVLEKGTRHIIYKLSKVLEGIKNHKTIFFVEGEATPRFSS